MTCPFCRSALRDPSGPCTVCGRRASEHPGQRQAAKPAGAPAKPAAPAAGGGGGDGWGDDDLGGGGLDLQSGGSMMTGGGGPSAYSGGGLGFGDDDPFADESAGASLELDLPSHHSANASRPMGSSPPSSQPIPSAPPHSRPHPQQQPHAAPPARPSSGGMAVPDLVLPPPSNRSHPAMPAVQPHQQQQQQQPQQFQTPSGAPPHSQPYVQQAAPPQPQPSDAQFGFGPPSSHPAISAPPSSGAHPQYQQPPPSAPGSQPQPLMPQQPAPSHIPKPPDPAAMIARYPATPSNILEAPIYAIRVLWRQIELRQDLAALKKKRSPDVALYERALGTHDTKTFALGLVITLAALTIASFIFFLPVILRFIRDD